MGAIQLAFHPTPKSMYVGYLGVWGTHIPKASQHALTAIILKCCCRKHTDDNDMADRQREK